MFIANLFFKNDRFADVDSFNFLAGDLEIALGVVKHNMCQQVVRYSQKHIDSSLPPRSKFINFFLQQEKLMLEQTNRFQVKGEIERNYLLRKSSVHIMSLEKRLKL